LELLQRKDIGEEERSELVDRMSNEIQRVNQTIRQLLDFSRPSSNERKAVSVHPLIQETLEVLDHQLRQKNIEVILELEAHPDMVFANSDQLKQVFLNLMVNAADAMEGTGDRQQGGELHVRTWVLAGENLIREIAESQPLRRRTDPATADYSHLRRTGVSAGERWLQIQFADTGVGIPKENQKRVFDPFYTTKEVGKGTGLGLSVSIQIIETLGGRMDLSSSAGEETRVTIQLPLYNDDEGRPEAREGGD
jgi:two-component system NtrC family sensor kinase